MKIISSLFVLFVSIVLTPVWGQSNADTLTFNSSKLSGSKLYLQIPKHFVANSKSADEFVCQPKGSVLNFIYVKNVTALQFCDSLTPEYFANQQLTNIVRTEHDNLTLYTGKFTNGRVGYIRAFCVYPYTKDVVLGIGNYPENLQGEIEKDFLTIFSHLGDE